MAVAINAFIENRRVVADGTLVFLRSDQTAYVQIDNLTFMFSFIPDPGPLAIDPELTDANTMRLRFTGRIEPLAASYELPSVGFWNGSVLHLACLVRAVEDAGIVVRELSYTFTSSPMPAPDPLGVSQMRGA